MKSKLAYCLCATVFAAAVRNGPRSQTAEPSEDRGTTHRHLNADGGFKRGLRAGHNGDWSGYAVTAGAPTPVRRRLGGPERVL
jgi:hypothetical protein